MSDFTGYICKYNKTYNGLYQVSPGAFGDCDGRIVPIVFDNNHNIEGVIGRATLELREDGVVANCILLKNNYKDAHFRILENLNNGSYSLGFYAITSKALPRKDKNGIKHYTKGDIRSVSVLPYKFEPDEDARIINLGKTDILMPKEGGNNDS